MAEVVGDDEAYAVTQNVELMIAGCYRQSLSDEDWEILAFVLEQHLVHLQTEQLLHPLGSLVEGLR